MDRSPCVRCQRVQDPGQCENKECQQWQQWFVGRWEAMRRQTRVAMEQAQGAPAGTCIGGTYYSLPHQVSAYLGSDPCDGCVCAEGLCTAPCPRKQNWLRAKEIL